MSSLKTEWYQTNFRQLVERLNGQSKSPLHQLRQQAFRQFVQNGFPHPKEEMWRFTDITPVKSQDFIPAGRPQITDYVKRMAESYIIDPSFSRLVFVNGFFTPELSETTGLPEGVTVSGLAGCLDHVAVVREYLGKQTNLLRHPFAALNTAFVEDGLLVHVPGNGIVDRPVQALFLFFKNKQPFVAHPRNLFVFGKNSQATLVETWAGDAGAEYFVNPVTEVAVGENAHVEHVVFNSQGRSVNHLGVQYIDQKSDSRFSSFHFSFGGGLVRHDIVSALNGRGVTSTLNGLYMVSGRQFVDFHTFIEHTRPHCSSRQLYKGILDDTAHGVFNGKIFVKEEAQKTDAIQNNKNLLLSDTAGVNTQPMLEIFADDVRCTHGGTVGQMDKTALHYLRSRGIGEKPARKLLVHSFAGDVVDQLEHPVVRDHTDRMVKNILDQKYKI